MEETIKLSEIEAKMTTKALARIRQYQLAIQETVETLQPVVAFLAENHDVKPEEYQLSEDGTQLVKRPTPPTQQQVQ